MTRLIIVPDNTSLADRVRSSARKVVLGTTISAALVFGGLNAYEGAYRLLDCAPRIGSVQHDFRTSPAYKALTAPARQIPCEYK